MKAAVCRQFGTDLRIEEVDLAPPGPGELEVTLAACAICHSDIHYAEGAWGGQLPAVYGHEAAGRVSAVGPGVELAVGDHVVVTLIRSCGECDYCASGATVFCETPFELDAHGPLQAADGEAVHQAMRTGAFAERVVVHASQVVRVPADLPLDVASLLACGVITGVGAVTNSSSVAEGSQVVVVGTGGVGLNAVQGAALVGADPIIAVDLSAAKLEAALRFGATHTVDAAEADAAARVRDITGGRGATHVLVTVGSKPAIESAFDYLRPGGELIIVGMPASGVVAEFDPNEVASRGLRIVGSKMGAAQVGRDIPQLVERYRAGDLMLDELISGRYRLERINEAIASVRAGEAIRNVIVFGSEP